MRTVPVLAATPRSSTRKLWNLCNQVRKSAAAEFPPWVDSSLSAAVSHYQNYSNLLWHYHRWICNKELHQASNDTKYVNSLSGLAFHVHCRSSWSRRKTSGRRLSALKLLFNLVKRYGAADFSFRVALCSCFTPTINGRSKITVCVYRRDSSVS